MSRSVRTRLLASIAVCSLLFGLAACGDNKKDDEAPKVAAPPTELVLKVLKEGTGATVQSGDSVTVDYQGTIWGTGKIFDQSYGKQPVAFATGSVVKGFGAALVGQKVGAQVVVGIPPEFGYGTAGQSSAGISGTDTLVFVVEIKSAVAVAPIKCNAKAGNASNAVKVSGAFGKEAKATFAKPLKAPALQRTVTKAGAGALTKSGDNVNLQVAIYNGRTGKKIEATPLTLQLGSKDVPAQFQAGVECVKVGSRVVTVFPAKSMFGAAGNAQAGIKPNDSLVLVSDVTGIAPPTQLPSTKEWTNPPEVVFNGTEPPTLTLPKA